MKNIYEVEEQELVIDILTDIDYDANFCPVTTAFERLNGKWKLVILFFLMKGAKRNSELLKAIPNIAEKVLAQRLDELENDRIITRTVYPEVPPRVEYALTPYGETLRPVFESLIIWGNHHKVVEN